ncbi:Mic19 protein [Martiniozyma asiatica (nom. inval.)]|nr:Mic19 protein [Martiniozyma asiatica]
MSEPKVFTPQTPTEYSAGFLAALDGSKESSGSRAQKGEQYIQSLVSSRLSKLSGEKTQELDDKIKSLILTSDSSSKFAGSKELNEKLDSTEALLAKIRTSIPTKSDSIKSAEENVTKCLLNNKGYPLNCWDEVTAFKKLVADQ